MAVSVQSMPTVLVDVDNVALTADDVRALVEVRVRQMLSQPAQCELTFGDPPGPLTAITKLPPGCGLRVRVLGCPEVLFDGQVTAIEYVYGPNRQRRVRVRAYDLLPQLRKSQTVRVFQQVTVADLAREIAAGIGATMKPCQSTLKVDVGYSDYVRIDGRRVCLDTVTGLTDGTPPGTVKYTVHNPGQVLISEEG